MTTEATESNIHVDEHGVPTTTVGELLKEQKPQAPPAEPIEEAGESTIDDSLREAARAFGYSDDELAEYSSDKLQAEIARLDRRVLQALQRHQPESERQQAAPPQPPQQQQQAPQQPQQIDWKALEDEYDAGIVKPMRAMYDRLEQMQTALQAYEQMAYAQQSDSFTRWFDGAISELGEEFLPVFGKGTINDLNPSSSEYRNRGTAENAFIQFREIDAHSSDDALLRRAVAAAFPEVQQQAAQKKLAQELKQRQRQTIGRPAGRKSTPTDADDRDPLTGISRKTVEKLQEKINKMTGA